MVRQPLVEHGLLNVEASRSHSDTPHSVVLLWTSDRPVAETCTWEHTTLSTEKMRDYVRSLVIVAVCWRFTSRRKIVPCRLVRI